MSFICHIHNYTEYNEEWNVFSAFNPSKRTHLEQRAANCAAPGEQSWTSCRSRDSNPQPWVTSGFKSNALSIRPRLPEQRYSTFTRGIDAWWRACLKLGADATVIVSTANHISFLLLHECDWLAPAPGYMYTDDLFGWRLHWHLQSWKVFHLCNEQRQWQFVI